MNTLQLLLLLSTLPAQADDAPVLQRLSLDFQSGSALHPGFECFGPNAQQNMQSDGIGQRIILRRGRPNPAAVGIATRFRMCGDFLITLEYEMLAADAPKKGIGAGVNMWCLIGDKTPHRILLGRYARPNDVNVVAAQQVTGGAKGKSKPVRRQTSVESSQGRLRLARLGSTLIYMMSDGPDGLFQEVQRVDVGPEDVRTLRISAGTSNEPVGLQVRLTGLTLRADEFSIQGTRPLESNSWLPWLLAGAGVSSVGGVWYWRRGR